MKHSLSDLQREKPREDFVITVHAPAEDAKKGDDTTREVDVVFINPKTLHWTVLADLDNLPPMQMLATVIPDDEQYRAFAADPDIDGEALEWVMDKWRKHYGLGSPGE